MVKIGIIGCGKVAQVRHIPEGLANPNATIVGYYDYSEKRAQETASTYGGKVYKNYEDMLNDSQIDAVCVLTPNNTHAEISIAALGSGKHVLCEKPMATTIEDCEAMVLASKEAGKSLMIGLNQRLARAHQVAKQLIEEDSIGRIITFRTTFGHSGADNWSIDGRNSWFFNKSSAEFGVLGDLGIHKTDLIHYLTGQNVVSVIANTSVLDKKNEQGIPIPVEDNAICVYTLSGGAIGTMTASWTFYGEEDNSTILYGTKGIMRIYQDPEHAIVIEKTNGERIHYHLEAIQTNKNQTKSGVIDEFIASIIENRPPLISGEEVLPAMKAVFAAMKSSQLGSVVSIS